jgi:NTE family protein
MAETNPGKSSKQPMNIDSFLKNPRVLKCLEELEEHKRKKPFIVSDVIDEKGNQYVHLVQKGGGVLGVALVGYTYILEKMGIRFMRLAGTSAGAINTAMMTVIDNKEDEKSEKILKIICDLNFFSLVDGHPAARWLIRNFITNKDFTIKLKNWMLGFILILVVLLVSDMLLLGLEKKFENLHYFVVLSFVLTGLYLVVMSAVLFYIKGLLKRLKNSGFGINPGDFFYDWLKTNMKAYGVEKVSDLIRKAEQPIPGLKMRAPRTDDISDLKGDVTFIASELVTQNKVQFPEMCHLFRKHDEIDTLQPAGFVRASMSIPIFFESYFINDIPCKDPAIIEAWKKCFGIKDPPTSTRFVDGGMLSNFPINIFYNPKVTMSRLPSFGIDLDDTKPGDSSFNALNWSLGGYVGRMFNTIRFYYDKDFLLKNEIFEKGIGKIHLSEYNWLNFFMKDEDKIEMFVRGAEAAKEFLINFDWETYKANRVEMSKKLKQQSTTKETV